MTLHPGGAVLSVVRGARAAAKAAWALAILGMLAALVALGLSCDRRRAARALGPGLTSAGLLLATLYVLGGAIAGQVAPAGRGAAARALWHGFLGGLQVQALWMAGAGMIVLAVTSEWALAAGAGVRHGTLGWPGEPMSNERRVVVSLGLSAAGIAVLLEPGVAVTLAAMPVGLYRLYRGAEGLLVAAASARAQLTDSGRRLTRFLLSIPAPALAIAGIVAAVAAVAVIVTGEGDGAPEVAPLTCNGHVALCGRTLNDVAFAATHNSMASVTIPTRLFGQQDGTIADQLDFGIRGLLIDTYYGDAVPGGVRTDLASLPKRDEAVAQLGEPAVKAAERLRSRLGYRGTGRRGIFLCHGICEIGAVPLPSALTDLRYFLVSHPGEVVIVINQDARSGV